MQEYGLSSCGATAHTNSSHVPLQVVSTMATTSLEDIAAAGQSAPCLIFQLYVTKDRKFTASLIQSQPCKDLCMLIPVPGMVPGQPLPCPSGNRRVPARLQGLTEYALHWHAMSAPAMPKQECLAD